MSLTEKRTINQKIDYFFEVTKDYLGDHFHLLLDHLQLSFTSKSFSMEPLSNLISVMNELNVTLDSVIEERVDFEALKNQFLKINVVPQKYVLKLPYSSRFTGFYMFDYMEKNFGKRCADLARQRLQLTKNHFFDVTSINNILLPLDITSIVLSEYGQEHVLDMGKHSIHAYKKSHNGLELSKMDVIPDMLERFFVEFAPKTVEKNNIWNIVSKKSHSVLLKGKPREELIEVFGREKIAARSLEILRQGFFISLPTIIDGYSEDCDQLKSRALGDDYDLYEIFFYNSNKALHLH